MSLPASPEAIAPDSQQARVWDLPLRVFHWLLVLAVSAAIATGLAGGPWMVWHGRAGQLIAGLLVFRLTWGLWGTRYARFKQFWPSPRRVSAYLRGRWRGVGHNPLGALSVLTVLALLLAQVLTGLAGNDEIGFAGPWSAWVSDDASLRLTAWHRVAAKLLYAWLAAHLGAIAVYQLWLKRSLLRPMWSGRSPGLPSMSAEATSWARALLSVAIAASAQLLL